MIQMDRWVIDRVGIYGSYLIFYGVCVYISMEGRGNAAISVKALCVFVVLCGWGGCCVYVCGYVVCSMYMCSVCLCLYGSVHMWGCVSACGGCAMGRQDCLHCIRVSIGFTLGQDIPTVIVERSSHWSRDSSGPFFSPSLAFWALTQQTQRRESCHLSWHAYHKKHCVASQGVPALQPMNPLGVGKEKLMPQISQALWGIGLTEKQKQGTVSHMSVTCRVGASFTHMVPWRPKTHAHLVKSGHTALTYVPL